MPRPSLEAPEHDITALRRNYVNDGEILTWNVEIDERGADPHATAAINSNRGERCIDGCRSPTACFNPRERCIDLDHMRAVPARSFGMVMGDGRLRSRRQNSKHGRGREPGAGLDF